MEFRRNKIIKCPNCKIPYLKVCETHQTFLKWYEGKMNETEIRGVKQIVCFRCGMVIDIEGVILIAAT